jgi:esterase/lipase
MKKRWIFLGVLVALGVTCALGPITKVEAPNITETIQAIPADLSQLEAYLAAQESQAPALRPNTEKKITWVNGPIKTPFSVVYLHGFSATRQETAPLSQEVSKALGANLFETRLTGHGQPGEDLAKATAKDWLEDTIEAFTIGQRLGDKVLVIGTSTGATLALWLASLPEEQKKGLWAMALMSPNLGPKDSKAAILTYPWANVLLPLLIPSREWEPKNTEQAKYWTTSYPSLAVFPMQALVEYVRDLDTTKLTTPALFIYNENDEVIDPKRVETFYDKLTGAKQKILLQVKTGEDSHVLAGAIVSPSQTASLKDQIVQFVNTPR